MHTSKAPSRSDMFSPSALEDSAWTDYHCNCLVTLALSVCGHRYEAMIQPLHRKQRTDEDGHDVLGWLLLGERGLASVAE